MIRIGQLSDLPSLLDIYNEAILTSTATFDLVPQTLEQRKIWFDKYVGNYPLLVLEEAGTLVGYSCLSKFREKDAYNSTTELSVYIHKDHQGRGYGKQLMAAIIEQAKLKGFHVVLGGITSGNEISIKLHEQFGFVKVAHMHQVGYKFDRWLDVEFYQLIIGSTHA